MRGRKIVSGGDSHELRPTMSRDWSERDGEIATQASSFDIR